MLFNCRLVASFHYGFFEGDIKITNCNYSTAADILLKYFFVITDSKINILLILKPTYSKQRSTNRISSNVHFNAPSGCASCIFADHFMIFMLRCVVAAILHLSYLLQVVGCLMLSGKCYAFLTMHILSYRTTCCS